MKLPLIFQRLEGIIIFLVAVYFAWQLNVNWGLFLLVFVAVDATMVGYLINNGVGAILYNLGHSFFTPVLLLLGWSLFHLHMLLVLAIIWCAHIGIDRTMGYGLKFPTDFKDTHLGRIGKQ